MTGGIDVTVANKRIYVCVACAAVFVSVTLWLFVCMTMWLKWRPSLYEKTIAPYHKVTIYRGTNNLVLLVEY